MKKKYIYIFVLSIIFLLGFIVFIVVSKTSHLNVKKSEKIALTNISQDQKYKEIKSVYNKSSVFIPFWALPQSKDDVSSYDKLMYFGISVSEDGVEKNESGYIQLNTFQTVTKGYLGKKSLVMRMLDNEKNIKILNDEKIQNKIILEINNLVKENGFTELALDLELSGFFSEDIASKINVFVQKIYTLENRYYRHFSVIIYGDVFYRNRPFDIKSIGKYCDEIMVMAYDFSKPYGEPGPNFPFDRRSLGEGGSFDFSYDFKQMMEDYLSKVSLEKLSVIFGMYGYDWTLNNQGTPLKRAEAVTVDQVNKILNSKIQNPNKSQISNSKEKRIEYVDEENQRHVIWYEDEESVRVKTDYLKEKGIGSIGYWAYGYF